MLSVNACVCACGCVRVAVCVCTVGVACAGLPSKDALDLLTPMLEDPVDFVRQGVLISMALVLQQTGVCVCVCVCVSGWVS